MSNQIQPYRPKTSTSEFTPPEVPVYLTLVFNKYISYADFIALSKVCKSFQTFVRKGIICVNSLDASNSKIGHTLTCGFFCHLTRLNSLDLSNNCIKAKNLKPLLKLSKLVELNLSSSLVELDIEGHEWKRLRVLNLSGNFIKVEKLTILQTLNTLTRLDISRNQSLMNLPSQLTALTELRSLNVSFNSIGDATINIISRFTGLRTLDISYCWIGLASGTSLNDLTSLVELRMKKTAVLATGVNFSRLTNLSLLDISENAVGPDGLTKLSIPLQLTTLNIAKTQMTDAGLTYLMPLTKLVSLTIENNQVSQEAIQKFSKKNRLTVVD